jgi:2-polyprenyl-3-methyl-5-hydroxy-6-metoxy-1,4-benzoquinol methylase
MPIEEWLSSTLNKVCDIDILIHEKNAMILTWIEGKDIIDVGCGTGHLVNELVKNHYNVTATDILNLSLKITEEKVGKKANIIKDDIRNTHIDTKFDTVICSDVLEHVKDDECIIKNLVKLTKVGGCIIVTVPAHKWLFGFHDERVGHKRRYTKIELINKFIKNYDCVRIEKICYWNLISLLPKIFFEKILKTTPKYNESMNFFNKHHLFRNILKILIEIDKFTSRFYGITLIAKFRKIGDK